MNRAPAALLFVVTLVVFSYQRSAIGGQPATDAKTPAAPGPAAPKVDAPKPAAKVESPKPAAPKPASPKPAAKVESPKPAASKAEPPKPAVTKAEPPKAAPKAEPPKAAAAEAPKGPANVRISFADDVMPLIDKLGCNATACHGSMRGKGGLRFSMFGADPEADYDALVRVAQGRRIDRLQPARSLLLQKAAGGLKHGGGKLIEPASPEYRLLLAWLSQGAPPTDPGRPKVVAVRVSPAVQLMEKGGARL